MTKFLNISTDNTLGGSSASDEQVASQKAVKEYVDNNSSSLPNNVTYFSSDTGVGVVPEDGIRLETVTSASTMSINPDVVTVISGTVGTATITLQVPSDNLAHVWDIIMTTGSTPSITIVASNNATIKYPMNFYWGASRDVEVNIVGASSKYYLRYGEFA